MTQCYQNTIRFSSVRRRKVEAKFSFSGGAITGNGAISLPDLGTLVTVPNRKTGPSRTAHATSGIGLYLFDVFDGERNVQTDVHLSHACQQFPV